MKSIVERRADLLSAMPAWRAMTLHDMLDWAADRYRDAAFVVTDERSWTYGDIQSWSQQLAAGLAARGVGRDDKVAIILANYPEFVALKFAVSRVGAVAVPINMLNRKDELRYLLEQSDSRLLVTMTSFRGNDYQAALDEIAPGWAQHGGGAALPMLREVIVFDTGEAAIRAGACPFEQLASSDPFVAPTVDPGDLCDIIYTSGTTGSPKGVMLTHDMVTRTAYGAAYSRALEQGHSIVFSLPMYHVFGYVEGLLAVPWVGGAIIPQLRFDPHDTLAAVERHRATDALLIPTMTLAVLDAAEQRRYDLSTLYFAFASGGCAPPRIWQAIIDELGVSEINTGYGMTETTATAMMTRPEDPLERVSTSNGRFRDVGMVGDPALAGRLIDYRVIDPETLKDVDTGQTGELVARGPGVTAGYYKKPEATAAAFTPDGWLRTGDLGQIDEAGYLTLVGRTKESYRCGGELVMPTEVEDLLTQHADILQAHVVPIPDERMGEVGVAFVVAAQNARLDAATLHDRVAGQVARYKVPQHFLVVPESEIPTTASGRARKFMLSERAMQMLDLA
ncbi:MULTISPECIES: AMP-binding protein [unclassified Sphingomonas]|uniref:AMP-binding protein n=1 Tax=unclassified Sphingomonas TaxID=196159 RepID=UPI00083447E4|nr:MULTISPECIES: AMP-binding protein [unclassified Sphingomonas]